MQKKILKLTIFRKWADLIISGEKLREYRSDSPYYDSRLLEDGGGQYIHRAYDEIHLFIGGYLSYNLPHIKLKWKGFRYAKDHPPINGEEDVQDTDFAIDVSEIIEVNVKGEK